MIRRAEAKDSEAIIRLLYQVNQVHADGRPDLFKNGGIKYTAEALKELLADENRPIYVHVGDTEEVDGYCFCVYEETQENTSVYSHKTLYIDDLCVEENLRGTHIGKELYEYVKQAAKAAGCYRVTLHVWECNPSAMKFYQKMGLQPLYTAMEYILNPKD